VVLCGCGVPAPSPLVLRMPAECAAGEEFD
jgi:hypothetical protein